MNSTISAAQEGRVRGSADPLKFGGQKLHIIFVLCLNKCIYHLHLGPFPFILH